MTDFGLAEAIARESARRRTLRWHGLLSSAFLEEKIDMVTREMPQCVVADMDAAIDKMFEQYYATRQPGDEPGIEEGELIEKAQKHLKSETSNWLRERAEREALEPIIIEAARKAGVTLAD